MRNATMVSPADETSSKTDDIIDQDNTSESISHENFDNARTTDEHVESCAQVRAFSPDPGSSSVDNYR